MLFNFLCSLLLLVHLAPLNGMTYLLKASFLKTQPHLSDSRLQKNFINTKRLFSSSKITPALLTGFSHKTLIVAHKTKQNEKNYRYAHTPCYQWIAGKLVDTCPFAETIDALLKAAAVTGFAAYTSSNAKESQQKKQTDRTDAACSIYNKLPNGVKSCHDDALRKYKEKQGYKFSESLGFHKIYNDKVYTHSEVRALRAQGIKGLILTVDELGQPIYDDSGNSERTKKELKNRNEKPVNERQEEKKPKQKIHKATTINYSSNPGNPRDPQNNRNNNKNHQKKQNQENRKQNSEEQLNFAMKELRGEFKMKQGQHSIYAVQKNQIHVLAELSGKRIAYISSDKLHNEIEVWDANGHHLGAIDPVTKKFIPGKGPVSSRNIKP